MQGNLPVRFGERDGRIQVRQQAHGAPVPTLRDPTPSPEDVRVTEMLVEAGKLLDIAVLDHVVIGRNRFVRLKERGLGFK